jgi:hypothetical protein
VIFYFNSYPSTLHKRPFIIFIFIKDNNVKESRYFCRLLLASLSFFCRLHLSTPTPHSQRAWLGRRGCAGRCPAAVRRAASNQPASLSESPPNPPPPPQTTATAVASFSARAPRRRPGLQRSEEQAGLPAVAFLRSCEPAASLT